MTGAVRLLRDKQCIRDFRVRHTGVFYNHLDIPRDIRGIRDIGVRDTEV